GILDGVTTNPSLIKKAVGTMQDRGEQVDMRQYLEKLLTEAGDVPVSLEVIGSDYETMVRQGRLLYKTFNPVAGNVLVKIPVDPAFSRGAKTHFEGIQAIRTLTGEGVPVNCTLIFTPEQALLAAKAGASIVSPFAGRVDDHVRKLNNMSFSKKDYFPAEGMDAGEVSDIGGIVSGIDLVAECADLLARYGHKAEVLAASLRNPRQTREAAQAGAHIATLPFAVIEELLTHELTMEGMQLFTDDVVPEYADLLEG
ncbi:MAG: transaldolase family protein, partial [Desulfohalobiaceae bacterium]